MVEVVEEVIVVVMALNQIARMVISSFLPGKNKNSILKIFFLHKNLENNRSPATPAISTTIAAPTSVRQPLSSTELYDLSHSDSPGPGWWRIMKRTHGTYPVDIPVEGKDSGFPSSSSTTPLSTAILAKFDWSARHVLL